MARFVFRLQSVLNIKLRLEEQQKLSFAAARRRLDDEELKLAGLMDFSRKEHKVHKEAGVSPQTPKCFAILCVLCGKKPMAT